MAEEGFKRKLAAILSADVEGYSRLMDDDEEATVRAITSYRSAITDLVQQYRGRVVDSPGDNILAEFASVVDSVNCAVEIQRELAERNAELPDNRKMQFRIGVNLGDVIEEDGRIYGDGVNIAARVESLAEAGGICISGRAHDQVENKLGLEYEDLGKHEVKNISRPIQIYRVLSYPGAAAHRVVQAKETLSRRWRKIGFLVAAIIVVFAALGIWQFYMRRPAVEPASVEKMAYPLPDKPSIAVLPFDNMSGDSKQEYFSDGISEEIISALSKTDKLFVIARNSTFTYKGKPVKVKQVAEELGVRYVLEGSVRIIEERVRITAQLIDATRGHHLWAERYDRELKDIFALQDEITIKIVNALQIKLTEGDQARIWIKQTENLDVYLKSMEAISHFRKGTKESIIRMGQIGQEIVDMAPESPLGYKTLAWYNWYLAHAGISPKVSITKAFKLAQKALSLDESDAMAYSLLGAIYTVMRQYEKAIAAGEKSVELDPNGAIAHVNLGGTLCYAGRIDEGIDRFKQANRLNPYPDFLYLVNLGRCYRQKGEYEKALEEYQKAHRLSPDNIFSNMSLAAIYALLDRQEEAEVAAQKVLEISPNFSIERASKSWPYKNQADLKLFVNALRKAGLPYTSPLPLPDKPSIAVLAFDNLSGDPEQEYFSDGLTDELIGDLAKISTILVISRNSAFTYKGKQVKIAQVAKELNVRYVLEGSVQKSGDRVRIRAQLIDGQTDHHLWAESYDGVLNDIFDLQDKITSKIVSALAVKLSPSEKEKIADKGTDNVLAYEAFLKGTEHRAKQTPEDYLKAIEYYKQALKIDPNFYRAHAAIGLTYQYASNLGWAREMRMGIDPTTMRLLSSSYLEFAMKNPSSEAYSLAAAKELHRRNFQKAIALAEKSYNYAPNSANILTALGWTLAFTDRTEESIELFNKAIKLDPLDTLKNTSNSFIWIGVNHFSMGNLKEAVTYLEKGLSLNPKLNNFSCFLAASHALLGHDTEAKKALADYMKVYPMFPPTIQYLYNMWAFMDSKVFDRFAQGLVKAGLRGDPKNYFKISEENRLNGEKIRKLLFGKTLTGYIFGIKELKWSYEISDDGELKFSYRGKNYNGKAWMEGENICLMREQYADGLKSCEEIYRNPDGDKLTKTEYFRVTDYGYFLFSVEN